MISRAMLALITVLVVGLMGLNSFISVGFAAVPSSLTVTVQTDSETPISGANVTVTGSGNSPERHTGVTGSNGKVTFSNLNAGSYHVLATAPGYQSIVSYDLQVNGVTNGYATFSFSKAYFTYLPPQVAANNPVRFDASLSNSSGTILSYSWDFGDNSTGVGISPTHVYGKEGTYVVLLTVTTTVGTARYSQLVQVATNFFPWILLVIPFLIPFPFILWYRRRRFYVVIQARIPPGPKRIHCPGDGSNCDECKLTPC